MEYIMSLDDDEGKVDESTMKGPETPAVDGNKPGQNAVEQRDLAIHSKHQKVSATTDPIISIATPPRIKSPDLNSTIGSHADTTPKSTSLDYEAAVNALTLQFLNENEATRVAALVWLIMLQGKAPRKVFLEMMSLRKYRG